MVKCACCFSKDPSSVPTHVGEGLISALNSSSRASNNLFFLLQPSAFMQQAQIYIKTKQKQNPTNMSDHTHTSASNQNPSLFNKRPGWYQYRTGPKLDFNTLVGVTGLSVPISLGNVQRPAHSTICRGCLRRERFRPCTGLTKLRFTNPDWEAHTGLGTEA